MSNQIRIMSYNFQLFIIYFLPFQYQLIESFMFKDQTNSLIFQTLTNDYSHEACLKLIKFKSIISKALPNMDRDHIVKLLFDHRHQSLIAFQNHQMIGGICYAKFEGQKFVEIAFLAVRAEKRIQGYGKKIINKLKSILQEKKIGYMLTYGDNMALGFFRKQGFSEKITMPRQTWQGYIKQYDGGKLIQCKIHQNVDYINIEEIIKKQKKFVLETIKRTSLNGITFRGTDILMKSNQNFIRKKILGPPQAFLRDPRTIPGVIESGWSWQQHDLINSSQIEPFNLRCKKLIQYIKKQPQSKYFLQPVSEREVPNYKNIIKNPMDFQTMVEKLQRHQYKNQQHFCEDIDLILKNCKQFNHQLSVYCKSAQRLKILIKPEVEAFKKAVISTSKEKNKRVNIK